MAHFYLGLDYGTGGAKACIIDLEGTVRGYSYAEYPLIHKHADWSEHDADLYWQVACQLIHTVTQEAGCQPSEIGGIAVSSALPSMVMVDRDHNPIHNAYNLMDRRAQAEVLWLKDRVGEERIFQLSGYRLEDHPVLVNVLWEQRNRPDEFQQVDKVLTIDGYITLKLTGKAVAHYSGAAFYGVAYNMRAGEFDGTMLDKVEIDREILPSLYRCEDVVGELSKQAAFDTGLAAGTPVAAGQVDCNASWVGAGAIDVGDFQSNLGSVGNFGIVHQNIDFNFSEIGRLMINFPYTVNSSDTFVTVPTTMTGGQCIRYIRDNFSQYEIEVERLLGTSSYDLLNLQAKDVPAGSEGLIILPFLMGERTPIWDVNARGVVFGLSLHHTKGHVVKAMMEGVAFAMYDSYRLLKEAQLKINFPMVLNEGGATSPLWRQIIADVFDVPNVMVKRRMGAPYGDAILAGVATGAFPDFSVVKQWVEYVEPKDPQPENHALYMELFDLYKNIYDHLKVDFVSLAKYRV